MIAIDLAAAPEEPGCYIFKDAGGTALYVGKAANIRARLGSYRPQDLEPRKVMMLEKAESLSFMLTNTEKEALILESSLIKKLLPKYNVRLTDDKRYPYIHLSDHKYPRVSLTRNPRAHGQTFGPFPDAGAAKKAIQVIREAFKVRDCKELIPGGCLNFQMNLCWAPCVQDPEARVRTVGDSALSRADPDTEHARAVSDAAQFLRGDAARLVTTLTHAMDDASKNLEFERAKILRDRVRAIQATLEKQSIFSRGREDRDAFQVASDPDRAVGVVVFIRDGSVAGQEHFVFRRAATTEPGELLGEFIRRYYEHLPTVPREILVPEAIPGANALAEVLAERCHHRVDVRVPQRGALARVLELAEKNARFHLDSERSRRGEKDGTRELESLRTALKLPTLPRRIECFDISHLHGTEVVASMSVLVDAEPAPAEYRRFKMSIDTNDDFAAMREVVERRYKRVVAEKGALPDLVLIDGGKGQLEAARGALAGLGLADLPLASLAKKEEEVFQPRRAHAAPLTKRDPGLLALMRARDEAHRFAVTYQRKRRALEARKSRLDAIPGVGASRRHTLLTVFGSADGVLRASEADLARTPGIGPSLARRIRQHLDGTDP